MKRASCLQECLRGLSLHECQIFFVLNMFIILKIFFHWHGFNILDSGV